MSKQIDLWTHTAFGSTYVAEDNDVESADRFELGYKVDRNFTETLYGFGRVRFDSDEFGNIDSRVSGIVGVGNQFFDDGKQAFSGEIGIGAHQTEFLISPAAMGTEVGEIDPATGLPIVTVGSDADDGLESDGAVLYLGANYSNALSDTLLFNSVLSVEATDDNSLLVWDNSLNVALSETISLSLGILTRTNTDVGDAFEETDTASRVNISFAL